MRPRFFYAECPIDCELILTKDLIQAKRVSILRSDRHDATDCHPRGGGDPVCRWIPGQARNDRGYPATCCGLVMDRTIIHTLRTSGFKAPRKNPLSGRNPERA